MQKYSNWRPTAFDSKGLGLEDRQDWLVLGVIQTRDSEVLAKCNFKAALEILGGEQDDLVEVHSFNHWGPGWFEVILLHPSLEDKGQEIEDSLENHPVLDEDSFSEMEEEERQEDWESWAGHQFVSELVKVFGLHDETQDWLTSHRDQLYDFHCQHSSSSDLDFKYLEYQDTPDRDDLAKFIKELRKKERK